MTDRDALLAAILANPDDDLPRLVYADWLEENGDALLGAERSSAGERAAFIRAQVEAARAEPFGPAARSKCNARARWRGRENVIFKGNCRDFGRQTRLLCVLLHRPLGNFPQGAGGGFREAA